LNIKKGDQERAEKVLAECITRNVDDVKILTLYTTIVRRQGRTKEALQFVGKALEIFPLYYPALFEKMLCLKGTDEFEEAMVECKRVVFANQEKVLEVAIGYLNGGFFEEAKEILEMATWEHKNDVLMDYYLGFVYGKLGDAERRDKQYEMGNSKKCDYVFPHRVEEVDILSDVKSKTESPNPSYYLGNLYFHLGRFDEAVSEWEIARKKKMRYFVLSRNLGYAYYHLKRSRKAEEMYREALRLNPMEYRLYFEFYSDLVTTFGVTNETVRILDEANNRLKKTSLSAVLADALVEMGEYEKALEILRNNAFVPYEGYCGYWEIFVQANVRKGVELLEKGKWDEALRNFQDALTYPANLGVGAPHIQYRHEAMQKFWFGECLRLKGDMDGAKKVWKSVFKQLTFNQYETYYKGMILMRLGETKKASILFKKLLDRSSTQEKVLLALKRKMPNEMFLLADYDKKLALLLSEKCLANMGLGKMEDAGVEFRKAIRITKNLGHYKWLYKINNSGYLFNYQKTKKQK